MQLHLPRTHRERHHPALRHAIVLALLALILLGVLGLALGAGTAH